MNKNKKLISFLIVNLMLAIAGITENVNANTTEPIKLGIVQEWDVFHPVTTQTSATESLLHFLFRDMVYRDDKGAVIADLAVVVPSLKNKLAKTVQIGQVKKVVAHWEIKKNAVWSDNTPVTCADWELGWRVGLSPNVSKTEQNVYSKIENIKIDSKDNKKCEVTYVDDSWTFDRDLPPLLPAHLERAIFETKNTKSGAYEQSSTYVTNPTQKGLYSGPYQITEIKLGSHVVLEENPFFWGQKPQTKKIIVKLVPNTATLKSYLLSHDLNAVASIGFPPDLAIQFESDPSLKDFKVHFKSAPLFQALFFNTEDAILSSANVRKAIALSIDKKTISHSFLSGKLNAAETIIAESDPAFIKRKSAYDLKKAAALLDSEGWKLGADGVRRKNQQALELTFKVSAGIKLYENIQIFICDGFKKIGVICKIKNEPPRILLGTTIQKGDFQLAMFGQNTYPDTSLKGLYSTNEIPNEKNSWTGGNIIRYSNKNLDSLLSAYDKEWAFDKRIIIVKKIENIIFENDVIIPIYHRREAFLAPRPMSGIQAGLKGTAIVFPEFWKM